MQIGNILENTASTEILVENRPTNMIDFVKQLKSHPMFSKFISVKATTDGYTVFMRLDDGNAYEFDIRPAPHAKGFQKERGVDKKKKGTPFIRRPAGGRGPHNEIKDLRS